jgi:hypothetical protein
MRHRWIPELLATAAVAAFLSWPPVPVIGQVRAPRPPAGPLAPAPRLPDGTPNLGSIEPNKGYWAPTQHQDYTEIAEPKEIPFLPWARALAEYRQAGFSKYDPQGFCLPPVGPRAMTTPYPMEIIQIPEMKRIVMLYEGGAHIWRIIYMDGREHPKGDALTQTWLGHSVGHWEGETLVVDVVGFNEGTWIDMNGKPHTDQLHLTERYTRTNLYNLHYEATIDDPGAYTAPWKVKFDVTWDPKGEIHEYICQENNPWPGRLIDDEGKPAFKE